MEKKENKDTFAVPRRTLFRRLSTRLTVSFCVLFLVIVVVLFFTGLYGVPFSPFSGIQGQQRDEAFKSLNLIADLKKERLMKWLQERKDDTKVIAESNIVKTGILRLRKVVQENIANGREGNALWDDVRTRKPYKDLAQQFLLVKETYGEYVSIKIADASTGKVILSTEERDLGLNTHRKEYFAEAIASNDIVVHCEEERISGIFDLHISYPVKDSDAVIAVLTMHVDFEGFIQPLLRTGEGLGETGEALLVNKDVRIITTLKHPLEDGSIAKPLEYQIKAKPAILSARGEEGIIETEDYRGIPVLAAYRYIPITADTGLGMVVKRDRSELFAPLRVWTYYYFLTCMLGIIFIVGITVFLSGKITSPLRSLSGIARKVAEGDFRYRSELTSGDEVGTLAETFNWMVDRVQNWNKELREQVHQRTEQLNSANEELRSEITERKQAESLLRLNEARLDALYQLSLMTGASLEKISDVVLDKAIELTKSRMGFLGFITEDEETFVIQVWSKHAMDECLVIDRPIHFPIAKAGIWAEAVRKKRPIIVNDYSAPSELKKGLPDGHVKLNNLVSVPIMDGNKIVALVAVANKDGEYDSSDVSQLALLMSGMWRYRQKKLADDALRESQHFIQRIADTMPNVLYIFDIIEQDLVYVNDELSVRLGYTKKEIKQMENSVYKRLIHPDDLPKVNAHISYLSEARDRDIISIETRFKHANGEWRWLTNRNVVFARTEDGSVKQILGTVQDITAKRKADDELASYREQLERLVKERTKDLIIANEELESEIAERESINISLKESENKFRQLSQEFNTLLDAIPDSIMLLSPELKVLWANKGTSGILGKEVHELNGQYCYQLWHNNTSPCPDCPGVKSFITGSPESYQTTANERFWDVRSYPIRADDGSVSNVIMLTADITEKMMLQTEAMHAAHLASLGELAAGVAHEINNPINGIINYAQILADKSTEGTSQNHIASKIIKEGDRIAHIVNNLLSFAREQREEKGTVRIREILNKSLALTEAQLRKEGITLNVDMPEELPDVIAHDQQIQQVFLNIINNARYALNQKYPGVHPDKVLTVAGEPSEIGGSPSIRVTFYDNGIGIAKKIIDKVINPFFSTKPSGQGTGLGLSISHGIISDHGGKLNIESNEDEFTRISIDLPAVRATRAHS